MFSYRNYNPSFSRYSMIPIISSVISDSPTRSFIPQHLSIAINIKPIWLDVCFSLHPQFASSVTSRVFKLSYVFTICYLKTIVSSPNFPKKVWCTSRSCKDSVDTPQIVSAFPLRVFHVSVRLTIGVRLGFIIIIHYSTFSGIKYAASAFFIILKQFSNIFA